MAGQLRHGTEAERTSTGITPASGELIHCTDSGAWYGGDGVTAGGNAMPAAIGQQAVTVPATDGALLFDGVTRRWGADALALADLGDMEPSGATDQQALVWDAAQSAYAPATPTPAGTRPIIVTPWAPEGLLVYLSFDQSPGAPDLANLGTLTDATITAHTDTGSLVITDAHSPHGGGALDYSGVTAGYLEISHASIAAIGAGPFTARARFRYVATASGEEAIFSLSDTVYYWGPAVTTGTGAVLGYNEGASGSIDGPVITEGDWCEVAMSRDGSGITYLHVNGVMVGTSTGDTSELGTILLGVDSDKVDDYAFHGQLDWFQLWDSCLTTTDYAPATAAFGPYGSAGPPVTGAPGTLWTAAPSNGLFLCTAAGPPATWARIAYASELPP